MLLSSAVALSSANVMVRAFCTAALLRFVLAALTVTLQVAFFLLPSTAVAVMVAEPAFLAVTTPLEDTVATVFLEDFQETFVQVFFFGVAVAFKVFFEPTVKVAFVAFNLTLVIAFFFTTTLMVAFFFLFFLEVTVILAVPAFTPFTTPLEVTVAIFFLLDL